MCKVRGKIIIFFKKTVGYENSICVFNKLLVIRKIFYCLWLLVVILGHSCFAFQIARRANRRLACFNSIMPIFGSCRRVLITLEGWLNDSLRMLNYFFFSWVSSFKNYFAKGGGTFYILGVCFFHHFMKAQVLARHGPHSKYVIKRAKGQMNA